jgi:hypothetical protein
MSVYMSLPPPWRVASAFLMLACTPCVAVPAAAASPSVKKASEALDFRHGVAVVAIDDAVDPAWGLATRVYSDPLLRPAKLDDATARTLAGEPVAPSASPRLHELSQARKALKGDDPMAGRIAASIAADLGGANLLVVRQTARGPHARLFLASSRSFYSPDLWQQKNVEGTPSWEAAVAWLHGHALASRPMPQPEPAKSTSIFRSGWFWGAIGAAATIGIVAATIGSSDDSSDSLHVRGRVGP